MSYRVTLFCTLLALLFPALGSAQEPVKPQSINHKEAFMAWRDAFRVKALKEGITPETFDAVFKNIKEPRARVFKLDRNQPEFKTTYNDYHKKRVIPNKRRGKKLKHAHAPLLQRIAEKYHVPAHFILALWGIETRYGGNMGSFDVVPALASLAYEGRRRALFERELISVMHIHQKGYMPVTEMKGSWSGAMGQCQFMPSSYLSYAVDEDADGRRDIWQSIPDIMGSIANYLRCIGWKENQPWGVEVTLPAGFDQTLIGLDKKNTVAAWMAQKVHPTRSLEKGEGTLVGSLIQVPGENFDEKRTFMVYDNFKNILNWNRSYIFAVAVGQLSDHLKGEQ